MENVTGFIERGSNKVTLEMVDVGCYNEVLAYDNTTIFFLSEQASTLVKDAPSPLVILSCSKSTLPSSGFSFTNITLISVVVVVVVVVVAVVLGLMLLLV